MVKTVGAPMSRVGVKPGVNLMIIRTLVATLAGAVLFGLTATSVVAQTTSPGAAAAP